MNATINRGKVQDMTVLALDLGTNTGWAAKMKDGAVISGSYSFRPGRYDGGGMRYLRFRRWLDEMYDLGCFGQVYFEEVRRHAGTDAAHVYGGLLSHLTAWCEDDISKPKIPYQGIPVQTIKKHATGKGNATKDQMVSSAQARGWMDITNDDNNEADALWILDYALAQGKRT